MENNNKINANLEAQAQALFKSWFVDFTPFKDQPFVDSELGPIPQGWKVGKLGDIALQSTEKVLTRNDVKVLSPITTGKLVLSEEYFTKQVFSKSIRNYKIVKQGAFAYNPARVNIGSLGMNEFKFDGCVSPVYVVFECLKGYSFFFDLFRKTEFFKQAVISFAIGGVRQTLNYSDFALIDVTIPPLNIVQSFNEIYLHLKKKISINEKENQRLAALRDTLLPKLMSGEIKL
ncbi:MAG: restriction endonuclease subunit S [Bacteroidales bacterium]|nr:restriction endonuclease subunit S [Bacteroidales bacterium]